MCSATNIITSHDSKTIWNESAPQSFRLCKVRHIYNYKYNNFDDKLIMICSIAVDIDYEISSISSSKLCSIVNFHLYSSGFETEEKSLNFRIN